MPAGKPNNWTGPERACSRCGTVFTPRHPRARYCTRLCGRKTHKNARRGAASRQRLFERDNWTCYLCLKPIDPAITTGPMRGSLDHVIPLSDPTGPGNKRDNIRAAHHGCNSRKSNLPLRLPGVS